MVVFAALAAGVLIATPLIARFQNRLGRSRTKTVFVSSMAAFFLFVVSAAVSALTQNAAAADTASAAASAASGAGIAQGLGYIGASLTTVGSCIGSGIAVAGAASAALGAISENEKIFGKALIMVALAESISLYGLLISILILNRL